MAGPHRNPSRQQGGTLTGLIVGLIIGLLIAVGVAMTIMKTPLPFVDKIGRQSQPAGELGDPNKTLPGAARERREVPNDTDGPAEAPAAGSRKPAPAATAPVAPPVAGKPPAASPNAGATSGDGFTYYLQAGAFRELPDADSTKAKLALMGVAASIAERKSEQGTLYRVRVGPFDDIDAMNRARVRLSDNGVDAAVVRVPK